jgi:hypothetical protein
MIAFFSPVCKKIPSQTCVRAGHMEQCPRHPQSYHAAREPCPKCKAEEKRQADARAEAARLKREQDAKERKASEQASKEKAASDEKLRKYEERMARAAAKKNKGPGPDDKGPGAGSSMAL